MTSSPEAVAATGTRMTITSATSVDRHTCRILATGVCQLSGEAAHPPGRPPAAGLAAVPGGAAESAGVQASSTCGGATSEQRLCLGRMPGWQDDRPKDPARCRRVLYIGGRKRTTVSAGAGPCQGRNEVHLMAYPYARLRTRHGRNPPRQDRIRPLFAGQGLTAGGHPGWSVKPLALIVGAVCCRCSEDHTGALGIPWIIRVR